MSSVCPGCKKTYELGASIGRHKAACKQLKLKLLGRRPKHAADPTAQSSLLHLQSATDDIGTLSHEQSGIKMDSEWLDEAPLPDIPLQVPLRRNVPGNFQDELPPSPPYIPTPMVDDEVEESISLSNTPSAITPEQSQNDMATDIVFRTDPDSYGVVREYSGGPPSITPDGFHTLDNIADSPYLALDPSSTWQSSIKALGGFMEQSSLMDQPYFHPFPNPTIFNLMAWFYGKSDTKSLAELDSLIKNVILHKDFQADHLLHFNAQSMQKLMDVYKEGPAKTSASHTPFEFDDSWIKSTVEIPLPCEGVKNPEATAPKFKVEFYRRKITDVLRAALAEPAAESFHAFPFRAYWQPSPDEPEEQMFSEMYTADAWNEDFEILRETLRQSGFSEFEIFIISILFWSDATSLTQFGNKELWPLYMYIGNQSKYTCAKPTSFAAHHIAYMPKLGGEFQEFYRTHFGVPASADVLTHVRRELAQAVLKVILDEDFMEAYVHGVLCSLWDKHQRLFFPRVMTYSADYLEKVLLACIKYLSNCPCPRCLCIKSKIPLLGSKSDSLSRINLLREDSKDRQNKVEQACKLVFDQGASFKSVKIEALLGAESLTLTRNAFSERLFPYGFNFYEMFAPDLLHEFELGVWKAVFIHLLRILHAHDSEHGTDTIQELNSRYRQIPSFGRDTIRAFTSNTSGLKKLAGRDYEDLLQCAIPVFDGLLPPKHDTVVRKLLFELATWHALAKLRLHTETTISDLEASTTRLGQALRNFEAQVCKAYTTYDLPSEEAARARRRRKPSTNPKAKATTQTKPSPRPRKFKLDNYKNHSLGWYARFIRRYGTTDNYNSQTGELEHRRGKRFFKRTHKGNKVFVLGIGRHVRRERFMHRLKERNLKMQASQRQAEADHPTVPFDETEKLPSTSPAQHYHMSLQTRSYLDLTQWLIRNKSDPALKNFTICLKNHLLSRLQGLKYDGDEFNYTALDRRHVVTSWFSHQKTRRRMKVHTLTASQSRAKQRMDFVFVRWFGRDMTPKPGWKAKRLHRLGFVPGNDEGAFGFLDPAQIIRAIHLIPAFHWGRVTKYLGPSTIARGISASDEDWQLYYIGQFADRDLMMRFRGGGVGHKSTRQATNFFRNDRDKLDKQVMTYGQDEGEAAENEDNWVDEDELMTQANEDESTAQQDFDSDEEFDYGFKNADSDDEEEDNQDGDEDQGFFGPEDDGGQVDPDMDELGYGDL